MATHIIYRLLAATGMATACAIPIEAIFTTTVTAATTNSGKNDPSAAVRTVPERLKWQSTVAAARANCGNRQWSSSLRHSDVRDSESDGCDTVRERLDAPKGAPKRLAQ